MNATTEPTNDLTQLGNELRVVLGRIVRRLRQGHEVGELTLSELSVLSRLDQSGALPAGVLADAERISPQAMSTILTVLEERALVTREADSSDGRKVSMSATPSGRRILEGRRSRNAQRVATALGEAFTPTELQQLVAAIPLLERLAEHL